MNSQKTIDALIAWIKEAIPQGNGVLIPVSGGSDSALCFWLCSQAIPERTKAVYIGSSMRCQEWFESVGTVAFDAMENDGTNPEVARWAHFLSLCLQEDRVLIGSRNLTETTLGTFSNASRVAAFLPLGGLWKHQVMELCSFVGIPQEITESSKRADPECGRPERMSDIAFEAVDYFLQEKLGLKADPKLFAPSEDQRAYLEEVYAHNAYKRTLPLSGPSAMR